MADDLKTIARKILNLERDVRALRQPQLGNSAIESGAIEEYDQDTLVQIIGEQYDGTHGSVTMNGPIPPTPSRPYLLPVPGGLIVRWDGQFVPADVAPLNFARVDLHLSRDSAVYDEDPLTFDTLVASVTTARGGQTFVPLSADVHFGWAVTWNSAGRFSEVSEVSFGTPDLVEVFLPPATAPEVSPALTITGLSESIFIEAELMRPEDLVVYHMSTVEGFTPTADTALNEPTRSNVFIVNALPDGTQIDPEVTYYFAAVAGNAQGDAAPSAVTSGKIDPTVANALTTAVLRAGFALVGALRVGLIEITPDKGIVIPQPGGGTITLPANGTEALITAGIVAYKFTLEGDGAFLGLNKVSGKFRLENGVTNPANQPTLGLTNPRVVTPLAIDPYRDLVTGLVRRTAGWVVTRIGSNGRGGRVYRLSDDGLTTTGEAALTSDNNWSPDGGITIIDDVVYGLGRRNLAGQTRRWEIRTINIFTGLTNFVAAVASEDSYDRLPSIGRNAEGTRLYIAGHEPADSAAIYSVRPFSLTGAFIQNEFDAVNFGSSAGPIRDLAYFEAGSFDTGTSSYAMGFRSGETRLWNRSLSRITGAWSNAIGASGARAGAWDGIRFRTIDTEGSIFTYSAVGTYRTLDVAYAWHDPLGPNVHTTMVSPPRQIVVPARAYLTVEADPAPDANNDDPNNLDKATSIAIFAAPIGEPLTRQRILDPTMKAGRFEEVSDTGIAPPATNEFESAGVTPGMLETMAKDLLGSPLAWLSGSGRWRLGDLSSDSGGRVLVGGQYPLAAYCVGEGFVNTSVGADGLVTVTHNLNLPSSGAQRLVTQVRDMLNARSIQTVSTSPNSFIVRCHNGTTDGTILTEGSNIRFDWTLHLPTAALPAT